MSYNKTCHVAFQKGSPPTSKQANPYEQACCGHCTHLNVANACVSGAILVGIPIQYSCTTSNKYLTESLSVRSLNMYSTWKSICKKSCVQHAFEVVAASKRTSRRLRFLRPISSWLNTRLRKCWLACAPRVTQVAQQKDERHYAILNKSGWEADGKYPRILGIYMHTRYCSMHTHINPQPFVR